MTSKKYLKGAFQRAHLVEDAAETPDVAFVVVGLALAQLGGDVAGRADDGVGLALAGQDLADPEVADLDVVERSGQKNIFGLKF